MSSSSIPRIRVALDRRHARGGMFGAREGLAHVVDRGVEQVPERLAQGGGAGAGKASANQSLPCARTGTACSTAFPLARRSPAVREPYDPRAIETPWQRRYVTRFATS